MGDFFRSAFSYLSQAGAQGACAFGGKTDHHLVGSLVEMSGRKLKIRSLLAEGGYALVFAVQDQQGNWYALKRQLAADREGEKAIVREIKFMEELGVHPSIVRFLSASHLKANQSASGRSEFLLLMELCSGGPLIDYFQKNLLSSEQVCKIFYATATAVQHMHDRNPPITHRDLKIENLLFDSKGFMKLCDFGSATTDIFRPNDDWNISKRTYLEEEMAKFTTPMYRAPEILDTYQNYPIGPAQDIWALGCILYYLCYRQHPFEDSAKLRIINAKYILPDGETAYKIFHSLIRNTLQPNPYSRPSVGDIIEQISDISALLRIDLKEPIIQPTVSSSTQTTSSSSSLPMQNPKDSLLSGGCESQAKPGSNVSGNKKSVNAAFSGTSDSNPLGSLLNASLKLSDNVLSSAKTANQSVDKVGGFFRSAFSYLSQAGTSGSNGSLPSLFGDKTDQHPLFGTLVEMSGRKLKIRSLLAEGGYALVFAVQDQQGNWYALKRQLAADREGEKAIVREIKFMEELGVHPSIVRFLSASHLKANQSASGRSEFLLLMELCSGGPLIDYFQKNLLSSEQVCKIFYATATAVQHMHDRNPPITHRDLKIENLLFDSKGFMKLCDFGSATTDIFRPNDDWNISKRTYLEEEMAKFTTPMYRAPEILDTYQNYPIGPAQDIWALGCILYYLCYRQHPFEDSAKLRIINAKYILPDGETAYKIFHSLIRNTLQPNPYSRPSVGDICDQVCDIAELLRVNIREPIIQPNVNFSLNAPTEGNSPPSPVVNRAKPPPRPATGPKRPIVQESIFDDYITSSFSGSTQPTSIVENTREEMLFFNSSNSTIPSAIDDSSTNEEILIIGDTAKNPSSPLPSVHESKKVDLLGLFEMESKQLIIENVTETKTNIKIDDLSSMLNKDNEKKSSASSVTSKSQQNEIDTFSSILTSFSDNNNASSSSLSSMGKNRSNSASKLFEAPPITSTAITMGESCFNATSSSNSSAKPNYSRTFFEEATTGGVNKVPPANAFDDILSSQGFSSSAKQANRSLADLKREEDSKTLDPITIKINDWTKGKERNILALLGSLKEVLWEDVEMKWVQPSMSELLSYPQLKKCYRKACLVVHPDKQTGTPHELLAKAIFLELKDAWDVFEKKRVI